MKNRGNLLYIEPIEKYKKREKDLLYFGIMAINIFIPVIIIFLSLPTGILESNWSALQNFLIPILIVLITFNIFFIILIKSNERFAIYEKGFTPKWIPLINVIKNEEFFISYSNIQSWDFKKEIKGSKKKPLIGYLFTLTLNNEKKYILILMDEEAKNALLNGLKNILN